MKLFIYGTLRPGEYNYDMMEPVVVGTPSPGRARGCLFDTGVGYPVMALRRCDPYCRTVGDIVEVNQRHWRWADILEMEVGAGYDIRRIDVDSRGKSVECLAFIWPYSTRDMVPVPENDWKCRFDADHRTV